MVAPGLAALETIVRSSTPLRGSATPSATWGVVEGNPVHDPVRAIGDAGRRHVCARRGARGRQVDRRGVRRATSRPSTARHCERVRQTAMVGVPRPYDVVVTTNSGYPLDQNLYQCVKGLKAAAGIVRDGGTIILAAACEDGLPAHGAYADLLATSSGPRDFLDRLARGEIHERDQWQVQVQAQIQDRSARPRPHARRARRRPAARVARAGGRRGSGAPRGARGGRPRRPGRGPAGGSADDRLRRVIGLRVVACAAFPRHGPSAGHELARAFRAGDPDAFAAVVDLVTAALADGAAGPTDGGILVPMPGHRAGRATRPASGSPIALAGAAPWPRGRSRPARAHRTTRPRRRSAPRTTRPPRRARCAGQRCRARDRSCSSTTWSGPAPRSRRHRWPLRRNSRPALSRWRSSAPRGDGGGQPGAGAPGPAPPVGSAPPVGHAPPVGSAPSVGSASSGFGMPNSLR